MNYPLISEYIEAIKSAEDNFEELSYLRPVLGDDGLPVMTSGNFAVVFKMKDEQSGKFYAVKCFTKEQEGRADAYREIAKELKDVSSPYLVSIRYLDKELFVDTDQTKETEFPVLLMDWVEGKTLDKYLRENLDDKYALEMLAYRFSQLAQWLIPQPFAHGDLKPDNILVREDGSLVLVDYDGMYVPAMKGQKARELGSPDFRHPQRTENDFDEQVDDFPFVSILLSLKAISIRPQLLEEYGATDRLLFSVKDYCDISNSSIIPLLFPNVDNDINNLSTLLLFHCIIPLKAECNLYKVIKNLRLSLLPQLSSFAIQNAIAEMSDGTKSFSNFSENMVVRCGYDIIPFLKSLYYFAMYYPNRECLEKDLSSYEEIENTNLDTILDSTYPIINDLPFPFFTNNSVITTKGVTELSIWYWKTISHALLGYGKEKAAAQYQLAMSYQEGVLTREYQAPNSDNSNCISVFISDIDCVWKNLSYESKDNILYSFLKESAMSGYINAQFEIARFYSEGPQLFRDVRKANEWRKLAKLNQQNESEIWYPLDVEGPFLTPEEIEKDNPSLVRSDINTNNVWTDEYGVIYSNDKHRLLMGTNIEEYTILDDTRVICDNAFENCNNLHTISIPNGVVEIGACAFHDCNNLASIKLPNGIKEIDGYTFSGCTSLVNIVLPQTLTALGYCSFIGCSSIKKIHLPKALKFVSWGSFSDCTSLTEVLIDSPDAIIHDEFNNCNPDLKIIVPESSYNHYKQNINLEQLFWMQKLVDHESDDKDYITEILCNDKGKELFYKSYHQIHNR